jgi:hypothetical protein
VLSRFILEVFIKKFIFIGETVNEQLTSQDNANCEIVYAFFYFQ